VKWSLYLGKISGIRLYIHWTFIILIGWIFFMHYQTGGIREAVSGVVFILALFGCVTLHEFGHALTGKKFHIVTKSITLLPIGGLAQMEKLPDKPYQELLVALGGPLVNVVIAIILFIYLTVSDQSFQISDLQQMMTSNFWLNLFAANVILALFNLIPAFPMDGGRVLRALLSFRLNRGTATKIAATVGQLLAILFVFFGFFSNIWLVFIGMFIYLGAGAEAAFETAKSALAGHTVKDALMRQFTRLNPNDSLEKAVQILLNGQEKEFIVTEDERVVGILSRIELVKGLSGSGKATPVSRVMRKDFITLNSEMSLQEVYQKMISSGCPVAPVIDSGNLTGIVNKENMEELLMVKGALKENSV